MSIADKSVISVEQFDRDALERIFACADECVPVARGEKSSGALAGKILANLFFEPSTRTRLSFGAAFRRLGGSVETTVGMQFSSMVKGETLEDTVRVISGYADAIVLRHPELGSAARAAAAATVPVVNGGDGPGEHPTQALLDVYTIRRELGRVDEVCIALVGDLRYGRTVHSLARLLTCFRDVRILLVSPPALAMPEKVIAYLDQRGVAWEKVGSLVEATRMADVLYVTRIQAERFDDPSDATRLMGTYIVDRAMIESAERSDITILHPLPRYGDLAPDVDSLPGAAYFRQAHNGVPIRMALFCDIFDCEP